jgi:hypothetical protein
MMAQGIEKMLKSLHVTGAVERSLWQTILEERGTTREEHEIFDKTSNESWARLELVDLFVANPEHAPPKKKLISVSDDSDHHVSYTVHKRPDSHPIATVHFIAANPDQSAKEKMIHLSFLYAYNEERKEWRRVPAVLEQEKAADNTGESSP